jgi:hypothetical protein
MAVLILLLFRHQPENRVFDLLYGGAVLTFLAGSVLWDRRYRRRWQNYQSRNWKRIDGRFDEGEVLAMRKARSTSIAGYEVWRSTCRPAVNKSGHGKQDPEAQLGWEKGKRMGR